MTFYDRRGGGGSLKKSKNYDVVAWHQKICKNHFRKIMVLRQYILYPLPSILTTYVFRPVYIFTPSIYILYFPSVLTSYIFSSVLTSYIFRSELTAHLYPSTSYIPPLSKYWHLMFSAQYYKFVFLPQYWQLIFSPVYTSYIPLPEYWHLIFSPVLTSYIFRSELTAYILRLVDQTAGQYRLKKYNFKKSSPGAKRRKNFGPY